MMMTLREILPVIVAVLGSGGLLGGIYALLKLRPEAGQIVVTAAQGALIVQTGVIDSLRIENDRLRQRVSSLEALREENEGLRQRVSSLESQIHELQREVRENRDSHG